MARSQEWVARVSGLSEKQSLIRRNIRNQEIRVQWMLQPVDKMISKERQEIKAEQNNLESDDNEKQAKYDNKCLFRYGLDTIRKKYQCWFQKIQDIREDRCNGESSELGSFCFRQRQLQVAIIERNQLDFIADF